MATRTALLNGNVINRDTDFSKHIEAVSEPGVISGFAVSSSSVAIGTALVKCERTNGDIIYAVVYNNSAQSISGDGDVYIEIPQELIDNGELMNEDGSEIAEIKVGAMPAKNALKLATKSGNTITDARNMIKKSGELLALINQNIEDIEDLDERVENLEEAGAIDHLEESSFVGERYAISNTLFKQYAPTLINSTIDCKVGDENANKQIHIQRIASGTASNTLKLKVKKVGSPTTSLVVEVRKGSQVNVSSSEAYWYGGGALVCSGSITYSNISGTYAEKTITLDGNYGGTKGELLDIVVYQTDNIVNASNYYCIACDSTQYSEGFSFVAVNGNTRTRSKLMPYCIGAGFSDSNLVKIGEIASQVATHPGRVYESEGTVTLYTVVSSHPIKCNLRTIVRGSGGYWGGLTIYLNGVEIGTLISSQQYVDEEKNVEFSVKTGDIISIKNANPSGGYAGNVVLTLYESKGNYIPLRPIEVKNIGEIGYGALYGVYPGDKKFYGGIMTGTDTSASTGNITLGNAVGFITVNLNGEIVKIPYYGN